MPAIESPCVKICVLDPISGLCEGCGRTGAEISAWTQITADERRQIMVSLPKRLESRRISAR